MGDGYLIVAQASSLVVFCQNSRLIDRYRDEIARSPEQAVNYYRLAQAAEAIGRDEVALASLELALPRARPKFGEHRRRPAGRGDPRPPAEAPDEAGPEGPRVPRTGLDAARRFEGAAEAARSDRDRLSARLELADAQLSLGEPKAAVADPPGPPGRRADADPDVSTPPTATARSAPTS